MHKPQTLNPKHLNLNNIAQTQFNFNRKLYTINRKPLNLNHKAQTQYHFNLKAQQNYILTIKPNPI